MHFRDERIVIYLVKTYFKFLKQHFKNSMQCSTVFVDECTETGFKNGKVRILKDQLFSFHFSKISSGPLAFTVLHLSAVPTN